MNEVETSSTIEIPVLDHSWRERALGLGFSPSRFKPPPNQLSYITHNARLFFIMFVPVASVSPTEILVLEVYAFGGLAFMIGIILFALGVWVWTVLIKREWANSPPDLELHPEVTNLFFFFF